MIDPPRDDVPAALDACRKAGVRVLMITGDHPRTAVAIARQLGMWREGDAALTGGDIASLDDERLAARLDATTVLARVTAEQKLRVVRSLRARGEVVAMTGDGVNDAPALRAAHIGVAMGRNGTEVARQAAALVLTDDRFGTLVDAIREGRAIYGNVQKFIVYLLSSNVGLALAVFAVALHGSWRPLTPLMILCINFVTNGPPALALGLELPMSDQMHEPPRDPRRGLLGAREALRIAYGGVGMGALAIAIYAALGDTPEVARSLAFAVLGISPLAHVWNCRSPSASVASLRPLLPRPLLIAVAISLSVHAGAVLVPPLRALYGAHALTAREWAAAVALSILIVPWVEVQKLALRRRAACAEV